MLLKVHSIRLLYENHTYHSFLKLSCSTLDGRSGCCGYNILKILRDILSQGGDLGTAFHCFLVLTKGLTATLLIYSLLWSYFLLRESFDSQRDKR